MAAFFTAWRMVAYYGKTNREEHASRGAGPVANTLWRAKSAGSASAPLPPVHREDDDSQKHEDEDSVTLADDEG